MEDKTFDLLEQRVKAAADVVRRLRKENATLAQSAQAAQTSAAGLQERLATAQREKESSGAVAKDLLAARGELKTLHAERDQIRKRIEKIVSLLDEIEG